MGHELFARTTLAPNQYRRISRRDSFDKTEDLTHTRALTDHVVFEIDLFVQSLILILQPLQLLHIINRDGCNTPDSRQQLQMSLIQHRLRATTIEVDQSREALANNQRHANQ